MAEKKKPQRRKSALAGISPVDPASTGQEAAPVTTPSSTPATTPASASEEGTKKKWPKKESFYRTPELAMRMRSAFLHTMTTEDGQTSLSAFIASAVQEKVERLEAKHNDGQPWPAVEPNQIPKGPPRNWAS